MGYSMMVETSTENLELLVMAQQEQNDVNGNPMFFVQVWVRDGNGGHVYFPKVRGYREAPARKGWRVQMAGNPHDHMAKFVRELEASLKGGE